MRGAVRKPLGCVDTPFAKMQGPPGPSSTTPALHELNGYCFVYKGSAPDPDLYTVHGNWDVFSLVGNAHAVQQPIRRWHALQR